MEVGMLPIIEQKILDLTNESAQKDTDLFLKMQETRKTLLEESHKVLDLLKEIDGVDVKLMTLSELIKIHNDFCLRVLNKNSEKIPESLKITLVENCQGVRKILRNVVRNNHRINKMMETESDILERISKALTDIPDAKYEKILTRIRSFKDKLIAIQVSNINLLEEKIETP